MRVCLGGTFDPLHRGHKKLIEKAFELGDEVVIGLSSDEFVNKTKKCYRKYNLRKRSLERFLLNFRPKKFKIVKIDDRYGPAVTENFDAIVVSPETLPIAKQINKLRRSSGKKTLKIIKIPFVLAEDSLPITSTRIKSGIIDEDGRVLARKNI
ncbi:MAG: phosphopantetheine adenylyltransferase [Candidatus Thermoplasmatota archaeon]|nr:phosphopantetheine adenylyltransferase [Candidatus Thermoplasmatota archaeon]